MKELDVYLDEVFICNVRTFDKEISLTHLGSLSLVVATKEAAARLRKNVEYKATESAISITR
jgi:hypothetical protein